MEYGTINRNSQETSNYSRLVSKQQQQRTKNPKLIRMSNKIEFRHFNLLYIILPDIDLHIITIYI